MKSPLATAIALALAPGLAFAQTATHSDQNYRFHLEGKKGSASADDFDAWMKERGINVAGHPHTPIRNANAQTPAETSPSSAIASNPANAIAAANTVSGRGRLLQVGSFANPDNARRALAQLSAAGIPGASLSDVKSAGRTMWRLRVQSEENDVTELVGRLASLGFGQAQIVRE